MVSTMQMFATIIIKNFFLGEYALNQRFRLGGFWLIDIPLEVGES